MPETAELAGDAVARPILQTIRPMGPLGDEPRFGKLSSGSQEGPLLVWTTRLEQGLANPAGERGRVQGLAEKKSGHQMLVGLAETALVADGSYRRSAQPAGAPRLRSRPGTERFGA